MRVPPPPVQQQLAGRPHASLVQRGASLVLPGVSDHLLAATARVVASAQGAARVVCHAAEWLLRAQPTGEGSRVTENPALGPDPRLQGGSAWKVPTVLWWTREWRGSGMAGHCPPSRGSRCGSGVTLAPTWTLCLVRRGPRWGLAVWPQPRLCTADPICPGALHHPAGHRRELRAAPHVSQLWSPHRV